MIKSRTFKNKVLVIIFMFLIIGLISPVTSAQEIKEINFKNTAISDVLRSIAEITNKNIVIDNSVNGNMTIHLKEISFKNALELITDSNNLDYRMIENTIMVATPERMKKLYSSPNTTIHSVNYIEVDEARKTLQQVFPKLTITALINQKRLITKGEKETVRKASRLLNKIDISSKAKDIKSSEQIAEKNNQTLEKEEKKEIDQTIETIKVKEYNLTSISENIKAIYSDLQIVGNQNSSKLILRGKVDKVKRAVEIIKELDTEKPQEQKTTREEPEQPEMVNKIVQIDYMKLESAQGILKNNFQNMSISTNPEFKELILRGEKKHLNKATKLLDKIDRPQKQVLIECRVEEISKSAISELGFKTNEGNFSRITFTKNNNDNINGIELKWPDYLDMLEQSGRAETLANPHLITLNGKEGNLLIGERIPVKMEGEDGQQSIKYIEAGINLRFKPWISSDNLIKLDVNPNVSSLGEELYDGYPSIKTREVSTVLQLKDGETFAIGGLIQEKKNIDDTEVPYLSDIPILGELFTKQGNDTQKTELLIFITPHIINNYNDQVDQQDYEMLELEYKNKKSTQEDDNKDNNTTSQDRKAEKIIRH